MKLFDKKNLVFGIVWGLLVIFLAGFLLKAIDLIQRVTDFLLEWALKVFVFPALIADRLNVFGTTKYLIIIGITILAAPFAKKVFDWLKNVFKKSPL